MKLIVLILAVVFLIFAFGYLYKQELIIKIHAFLNLFVFNDSYLLHYRRRVGIICLLISIFLFFLVLNG